MSQRRVTHLNETPQASTQLQQKLIFLVSPSSASLIGRPGKALYDPHDGILMQQPVRAEVSMYLLYCLQTPSLPWEWKMKEIAT